MLYRSIFYFTDRATVEDAIASRALPAHLLCAPIVWWSVMWHGVSASAVTQSQVLLYLTEVIEGWYRWGHLNLYLMCHWTLASVTYRPDLLDRSFIKNFIHSNKLKVWYSDSYTSSESMSYFMCVLCFEIMFHRFFSFFLGGGEVYINFHSNASILSWVTYSSCQIS